MVIPFNTKPVLGEDEKVLDDTGKRVNVNSVGGALRNVKGTVVYGPHIYWYKACTRLKPRKKEKQGRTIDANFWTEPYWCVLLDGFALEIKFIASELEFQE